MIKVVKKKEKIRNSNFEILRIVCMLLIVMHHYAVHGGFNFSNSFSFNKVWVQFLSIGGKVGVNCFVLISGYFLYNQDKFKIKKLFKLIFEVIFFKVLIDLVFIIFNFVDGSSISFKSIIFSPFNGTWWFISIYIILMLIAPFISKFIKSVNKKDLLKIIIILTFIWCIIPTFTELGMEENNLLYFIYLFLIGSYLKKYPNKYINNKKLAIITFLSVYLLMIIHFVSMDYLIFKNIIKVNDEYSIISSHTIPIMLISLSLFCIFKNMKPKYNKVINIIASSMLGVYIIHEHKIIRLFIWIKFFKNYNYQVDKFLIVHSICSIVFVFIVCTILSLIYNFIIDKLLDKILEFLKKHFIILKKKVYLLEKQKGIFMI